MKSCNLHKKFFLLAVLILIAFFYSCNNPNSNLSTIIINTNHSASRSINDVTSFRLTISANNMATIEKTFSDEKISLTVESGSNRLFVLEALNKNGICLYKAEETVNLTEGESVEIFFIMKETITTQIDDLFPTYFTSPTLTWNEIKNATSYKLKYAESEQGLDTAKVINCSSNSFTFSKLEQGKTYYWKSLAVINGKDSYWSDTFSFKTKFLPDSGIIPVENAYDLINISKNESIWNRDFEMAKDIDMNLLPDSINFTPIGTGVENEFTGNFDGNDKAISNLKIDSNLTYQGLFGYVCSATIKNLSLASVNIVNTNNTSGSTTGGLAGLVDYSSTIGKTPTISNCHVSGQITSSSQFTGGLIGYVKAQPDNPNSDGFSSVTNCSSSANLKTTFKEDPKEYGYTGGIIGFIEEANINGCINSGEITTDETDITGGITGKIKNTTLRNSSNKGAISGGFSVGGITGEADKFLIENCYNTAAITGNGSGTNTVFSKVGGVAGVCYVSQEPAKNDNTAATNTLSKSFNTGTITGKQIVGGLLGSSENDDITISNSYNLGKVSTTGEETTAGDLIGNLQNGWVEYCYSTKSTNYFIFNSPSVTNPVASRLASSQTKVTSCYYESTETQQTEDVTLLTRDEMKSEASYSGWDFYVIWGISDTINEGFPYLRSIDY